MLPFLSQNMKKNSNRPSVLKKMDPGDGNQHILKLAKLKDFIFPKHSRNEKVISVLLSF